MDFFINISITGISFIFLSKLTNKENKNIQEFNNLKFLNKLICYIESELFAKIHLKYGIQLLICGLIGVLFYNILGFFMVVVTVLILIFYLANIFINGYKQCFLSK